jgi:hypothetical protein
MRTMLQNLQVQNEHGVDVSEQIRAELSEFADLIGLERAASGRYSVLLLLGLFGGFKSRMQNPWKVMQEIEALEGIRPATRTKSAEPFKRPELRGLMHKHHLADGLRSFALNIRNEIKCSGLPLLQQRVAEAQASGEPRYFTVEDAKWIAHEASVGSFERRNARGAFTGEWIIYAQHEAKNYYLCLGRHDSDDADLKRQIDAMCCVEFPFLRELPAFRDELT